MPVEAEPREEVGRSARWARMRVQYRGARPGRPARQWVDTQDVDNLWTARFGECGAISMDRREGP